MTHVANANLPPYNAVGMLYIRWSDNSWRRGSGALIDANHVLTCSHNVVSKVQAQSPGHAQAIYFYPGYNQDLPKTQPPPAPVGLSRVEISFAVYSQRYQGVNGGNQGDSSWDVAILRLAQPITLAAHSVYFIPSPTLNVVYKTSGDSSELLNGNEEISVRITGYPGGANGLMYEDLDEVAAVDLKTNSLAYTNDSMAGSSGSPIYTLALNGQPHVYAVHVQGPPDHTPDTEPYMQLVRRGILMTPDVLAWIQTAVNIPNAQAPAPGPNGPRVMLHAL